jgi:hypothetical protein
LADVQNKLLVIAEGVGMVDIDQVFPSQDGYEPKGGDPLNQEGANSVIAGLMGFDDQWSSDDMLREGNFTKFASFLIGDGTALQVFRQDDMFILVRFGPRDATAQYLLLGDWARVHPRWLAFALTNFVVSSWGI